MCTVYLIPERDRGVENWLRRNYRTMFERELWSWWTDETVWPEKRTFREFKRFFNIRVHSMVFDMGKGPVVREDE